MTPLNSMSLFMRDAVGDAESVPETFSSWHNCMQKDYCKYPAIIGIIIASLIVLSIVGCLVSCICCGVKCCGTCCSCCYDCCECCVGGNHNRKPKYADPPAPYYQQPPPPQPMNYGSPAPPAFRGASTAQFDQSTAKKGNDDALPAMPTWAEASTRKVEDRSPVSEDVEMDRFDAPGHNGGIISAAGRMTRGGYTELPSSRLGSPNPSHQDGYRGAEASSFPMPPPSPRSARSGGMGGNNSPSPTPSSTPSYRGFQNQAPIPSGRGMTPKFHTPRPYNQLPSPTSPNAPNAQQSFPQAGARSYNQLPSPTSPNAQQPSFPPAGTMLYDRRPSPNPPGQQSFQPAPKPYERFPSPQPPAPQSSFPPAARPLNLRPSPSPPAQHAFAQAGGPLTHLRPSPSPPVLQPAYTAYGQQPQSQSQTQTYKAFSPHATSTPPPPFSEVAEDTNARPPSLLQAGRKAAPNSWRDV